VSGGLRHFRWDADLPDTGGQDALRTIRQTEDALTRRCDLQGRLEQHHPIALNSRRLLRLRLCQFRESEIRDPRFGDRFYQKKRI
jgi:hypothetical protein